MKKRIVGSMTAMLMCSNVPASALSANELLTTCEALLRTVRPVEGRKVFVSQAGQECWTYLQLSGPAIPVFADDGGGPLS